MSVVAVLCSDIHLGHNCPTARFSESSWYDAMRRYLEQVNALSKKHKAPVLCAGDVFDKWQVPPQLINFAITNLPTMYAVMGQHDLPYHNMDNLHQSPFFTMMLSGKICANYHSNIDTRIDGIMRIHFSHWGWEWLDRKSKSKDDAINVLISHKFVWCSGKGYPGAPKEAKVANLPDLNGYDVAVFGDNHQTFVDERDGLFDSQPRLFDSAKCY
jgi:predicted phosphodiesterase